MYLLCPGNVVLTECRIIVYTFNCLIIIFLNFLQKYNGSDAAQHVLKILVVHGADEKDPVDVSILLEGQENLSGCNITANACALLMGLIDTLNLAYPLRYTFEVFQKLYFELDGMKLSPKVHALKLKLLSHYLIAIGSTAQS